MGSSRLLLVMCAVLAIGMVSAFTHTTDTDGLFRAVKAFASTKTNEATSMMEWLDEAVINVAKALGKPRKTVGDWVCPTSDPNAYCDKVPDMYWRWMPLYLGSALPDTPVQWSSPCFKVNTAVMKTDILGIHTLEVSSSEPNFTTPSCLDNYMFGTAEWFTTHEITVLQGDNSTSWSAHLLPMTRDDTKQWFQVNGVRIFRFLDDAIDSGEELYATLTLFFPNFVGPHVPPVDQKDVMKFIKDYSGIVYEPRMNTVTDINEDDIADGTLLCVFRPDGTATIQIWATGSHTNHQAMAVRINGTLHVVESTDKTAYWPNPNIQSTVWSEWIKLAFACNYSIALLPLKDSFQAQFEANLPAVVDFVSGTLGKPYGYHNFLFGFFDTENDNLPFPASWELFEILFCIVDFVQPSIGSKMWGEAFSQRLYGMSTMNSTASLVTYAATQKGLNMGQLWAIPEQDSWVYSNGASKVCDVYVCSIYKVAGFLGPLADQIQCTEFQNSDMYQLYYFNMTAERPQVCQTADPNLPYCMLMGEWQVDVTTNKVSTTTPYPNMDQTCPSVPEQYWRPDNC